MYCKLVYSILIGLGVCAAVSTGACAQSPSIPAKPEVLKVGTAGIAPYSDILKFALDHSDLKQQGVDVRVVEVTDFVQLNPLAEQRQRDANSSRVYRAEGVDAVAVLARP